MNEPPLAMAAQVGKASMPMTSRFVLGLAGAIALTLMAGAASAQQVNDQTLSGQGFYNGNGNPSDNFAVSSGNLGGGTIELGLRARYRGGPNVTPDGNIYTVSTGTGPTGLALWNFDFSIDLGNSGYHLSDFLAGGVLSATLAITSNTAGTASISPVTYWGDSATTDGTTIYQNGIGYSSAELMSGIQNSENLAFPDSPLPGFNPWNGDTYIFTLTLNQGEQTIASVQMDVEAVPEPATMTLLAAGMLGLGLIRRRR